MAYGSNEHIFIATYSRKHFVLLKMRWKYNLNRGYNGKQTGADLHPFAKNP